MYIWVHVYTYVYACVSIYMAVCHVWLLWTEYLQLTIVKVPLDLPYAVRPQAG